MFTFLMLLGTSTVASFAWLIESITQDIDKEQSND